MILIFLFYLCFTLQYLLLRLLARRCGWTKWHTFLSAGALLGGTLGALLTKGAFWGAPVLQDLLMAWLTKAYPLYFDVTGQNAGPLLGSCADAPSPAIAALTGLESVVLHYLVFMALMTIPGLFLGALAWRRTTRREARLTWQRRVYLCCSFVTLMLPFVFALGTLLTHDPPPAEPKDEIPYYLKGLDSAATTRPASPPGGLHPGKAAPGV